MTNPLTITCSICLAIARTLPKNSVPNNSRHLIDPITHRPLCADKD